MAKNNTSQWTLTLLRVVLGVTFAYHGYLKLFAPGAFKGTAAFFVSIGIPFAVYSALLVALVEFVGGMLLLIGLLARWASALLIIEMLVALFKVHLKQGFLITPQAFGYEFVLLILAALIVILVNGPGSLSVGKRFFKSKQLQ